MFAALYAGTTAGKGEETQEEFKLSPPFSTVSGADWADSVNCWITHGARLLSKQPNRPCPACNSDRRLPLFTSHDGHPFTECMDCGSWYVPVRVDRALYERFFRDCPEARNIAVKPFEQRSSIENLQIDLERIGAYLDKLLGCLGKKNPTYLDIGAGMGASLIAARDRGVRGIGTEIDVRAIEVARARGVKIAESTLGLPDGPFDLVSFWESLEHICDPVETLSAVVPRLAAGGLVAITIPNLDSPMARLMRGDCAFVGGGSDAPGHISLLGITQLEKLLDRSGLTLLDVDAQYGTNMVELAGYLLGRHHGAASLVRNRHVHYYLPSTLAAALKTAGPVLSLVEREAKLSPILFAVACSKSDTVRRNSTLPIAKDRRVELDETFRRLQRDIPDHAEHVKALQLEVNVRDNMLQKIQRDILDQAERMNSLQLEVNKRDEMLRTLQNTANDLQALVTKLQK